MPQPSTTASRPPSARFPLRSLLGLVGLLALFFYACTPNVPREISNWRLALAEVQVAKHPALAMRNVERSLTWDADNERALYQRVLFLEDQGDMPQAIAAIDEALQVKSLRPLVRLHLLQRRLEMLQRQGKHQAAINNANQMLAIGAPDDNGDSTFRPLTARQLHNLRAYTIARAAVDKQANQTQIANAKQDMNKAFAELQVRRRLTAVDEEGNPFGFWENEAMFLDTIGYVEFTAGNYLLALRDLNRAVQLCDLIDGMWQRASDYGTLYSLRARQRVQYMRAVVLHHRGEVLLAMGNKAEGELNIQMARAQGYSREQGNW